MKREYQIQIGENGDTVGLDTLKHGFAVLDEVKAHNTDGHIAYAAIQLASWLYEGHVNEKSGEDSLEHLRRVAGGVNYGETEAVAYLHDTVEDRLLTFSQLVQLGFPHAVCGAVNLLARQKGQPYHEYVWLLSGGPWTGARDARPILATHKLAIKVKLADLEDNANFLRLTSFGERDISRMKKYFKAYKYLKGLEV
jgi:(p)ppGpp synthase/HD superfamily hydrolase